MSRIVFLLFCNFYSEDPFDNKKKPIITLIKSTKTVCGFLVLSLLFCFVFVDAGIDEGSIRGLGGEPGKECLEGRSGTCLGIWRKKKKEYSRRLKMEKSCFY